MLANLLVVFCLLQAVLASLNANAWQSTSATAKASDFPEYAYLKNKPNTAIAFTGGGSRAYVAALGQLAGLQKLDLMKNVRYIGGISGGAWATTTYTWAQTVQNEEQFLGPIVNPENIAIRDLQNMDPKCARGLAAANLTLIALEAYKNKVVDTIADAWAYGVSKTYLEPVGIPQNTRFSWNQDSVNDIKKRNPSLNNERFVLPANANRPYPIIGTALVGPSDGAPYTASTQNYTMIEITPLYVGQIKNQDVDFKYNLGFKHTRRVGGLIEPFAFAQKGSSPTLGLGPSKTSGSLNVPEPSKILDLQAAAGASSYAPGSLVESLHPADLATTLGLQFDYWSTTERLPSSENTLFADGGCYENIPLISYLQRQVTKIALFFNDHTPLSPTYNPDTEEFTGDQLSDALTSFFGVLEKDQSKFGNRTFEYERNQVFAKSDYSRVIRGLQAAQAQGNGIVATFDLTTIENTWWGIPAGFNVEITFAYLGRLKNWESKLSSDMYEKLVPKDHADDLSKDVDSGAFRSFPHYFTLGGEINSERANVLADLTGWSVLQNADTYRKLLS